MYVCSFRWWWCTACKLIVARVGPAKVSLAEITVARVGPAKIDLAEITSARIGPAKTSLAKTFAARVSPVYGLTCFLRHCLSDTAG